MNNNNQAPQETTNTEEDFEQLMALRGCIQLPEDIDIDELRYEAIMEKHG